MNDQDRCTCLDCPAAGCRCGCEAAVSAAMTNEWRLCAACAGACGCDTAEQGCLCTG